MAKTEFGEALRREQLQAAVGLLRRAATHLEAAAELGDPHGANEARALRERVKKIRRRLRLGQGRIEI